jgi:hypothetical protein
MEWTVYRVIFGILVYVLQLVKVTYGQEDFWYIQAQGQN